MTTAHGSCIPGLGTRRDWRLECFVLKSLSFSGSRSEEYDGQWWEAGQSEEVCDASKRSKVLGAGKPASSWVHKHEVQRSQ